MVSGKDRQGKLNTKGLYIDKSTSRFLYMVNCQHLCDQQMAILNDKEHRVREIRSNGKEGLCPIHRYARRNLDVKCNTCDMAISISYLQLNGMSTVRCFCCGGLYAKGGYNKRSPDHPKFNRRYRERGLIKIVRY